MSVFIFLICPGADDGDDILGVEEVARLTGFAESTVRNRKAGLRRVPLARRKPLGWRRRDILAFVTPAPKETPAQRADRFVEMRGRRAKVA